MDDFCYLYCGKCELFLWYACMYLTNWLIYRDLGSNMHSTLWKRRCDSIVLTSRTGVLESHLLREIAALGNVVYVLQGDFATCGSPNVNYALGHMKHCTPCNTTYTLPANQTLHCYMTSPIATSMRSAGPKVKRPCIEPTIFNVLTRPSYDVVMFIVVDLAFPVTFLSFQSYDEDDIDQSIGPQSNVHYSSQVVGSQVLQAIGLPCQSIVYLSSTSSIWSQSGAAHYAGGRILI